MKNVRQKDFRKTEKNLIYFAAKSTILSIKTPLAEVKICRIIFGSDGSIYVPFPYLNNKQGILSKIEIEPTAREPITYDLIKGGVEVSYDVKFTHHKSGIVQFSRTGTNENLPRHNSFPLDNQIGHIFNLLIESLYFCKLD